MSRALSNPVRVELPTRGVDGRGIISRARAPLITDGRIGDFFIDTVSKKLYGPKNAAGWPDNGLIKGDKGWTGVPAAVTDGSRRVMQIVDWQGGEGTKPATGKYVGATGLVDAVADAIDIRGPEGPEMVIDGLTPAAAAITDDTQMPVAETGDDNEKRTVVEVFNLGTVLDRNSLAHAEASAVDPLIKCLRTQFRDPDYAERATLVGGASYVRVNAEPSHAGKFRSTDRFTAEGDSDSVNGGWWELRESRVSPRMLGAFCDGVIDDTAAIMATHQVCNALGVQPDYSDVRTFAIQADAQIPINTDVDFHGAKIVILNGMVGAPTWSLPLNKAFVVSDPDAPVVTATVTPTASDFAQGSFTSAKNLIDGPGFVEYYLSSGGAGLPRLPNREGTGTLTWRSCHKVFDSGFTQHPMPVDGSAVTEVFKASRRNSDRPITIKGVVVNPSQFNQQTIFRVERNEVTIDGFSLEKNSAYPALSINALITSYRCADLTLLNVRGVNPNNSASLGTYVFSPEYTANIRIERCDVRGGDWAWMGAHFCNGMTVRNSDLVRIDVHAYSCNVFVEGVRLHERGISVGHGGGLFKIKDVTFFQTRTDFPMFHGRPDYGRGSWDGAVSIEDATIVASAYGGTRGVVVCDYATYPVGNAEIALKFPQSISIKNVHLQRNNAVTTTTYLVTPVAMLVDPTSQGVVAPAQINVDGVTCNARFAVSNYLDLASCLAPPTGGDHGTRVSMSNIPATSVLANNPTIDMPASGAAPRNLFAMTFTMTDVANVHLSMPGGDYNGSFVAINGGSVRRASVPAAFRISYTGVDFPAPLLVGAETAAPLCPDASGSRYATITGGRVAGAYDLSKMSGIVGLVSDATTIGAAVLPSGATRATMFTGWGRSTVIGM